MHINFPEFILKNPMWVKLLIILDKYSPVKYVYKLTEGKSMNIIINQRQSIRYYFGRFFICFRGVHPVI